MKVEAAAGRGKDPQSYTSHNATFYLGLLCLVNTFLGFVQFRMNNSFITKTIQPHFKF